MISSLCDNWAPSATPTRKQGRPGGRALRRGGGPRPGVVRLAPVTKLHFRPGAKKRGLSAERLERYRSARAFSEFFYLHPGPEGRAKADLTNDQKRQLCETEPLLGPCDFEKAELNHAERARAVLEAAARGRTPGALAAVVGAVTAAAARQTPTGTELLGLFAAYGELEGEPAQEWIAGALGPLGALVLDGAGDELRGYDDVLVAASMCTVKLRRTVSLDELRDQDGKPCAPVSMHASYFIESALRESDDLRTAFTVGRWGGAH